MSTLISRIRKNASEEIWISIDVFEGHELLNIRAYFRAIDGFQPTRKGIAVPIPKIKFLGEALRKCLLDGNSENNAIIIPKNTSEEIRIFQGEFHGHHLMYIRVFFRRRQEVQPQPSHKGIAFNVNLTNEIIKGIEIAERAVIST